MLIRVKPDQLKIGMYVDSIEGAWLDHPFWRSRFLIKSAAQLSKLRDSDLAAFIIDDSRGCGVDAPGLAMVEPPVAAPTPRRSFRRRLTQPPLPKGPSSAQDELKQATAIVARSKAAVQSMFDDIRLGKAVNSRALAPVVDDIVASVTRNPFTLIGVARLKNKDEYTYLHSVAVCALMINLAGHLGIDPALHREIGLAGLLHDVGKMTVPAALLHKPGALSPSEFALVKNHPRRGYELLVESGNIPPIALDVCLHHHERVDGTGYPDSVASAELSIYARMGAICDVYDAVTSVRPYKAAWHPADALAQMASWQGHFDAHILSVFERSVGIYPVGTLVRLRSNKLAVIVEEGADDLARPVLTTFYSVVEERRIAPVTARLCETRDRIVSREDPATWSLGDWPTLRATLLAPASRQAA